MGVWGRFDGGIIAKEEGFTAVVGIAEKEL
jgi:hypothetical protein